jgi:hypothetical protein
MQRLAQALQLGKRHDNDRLVILTCDDQFGAVGLNLIEIPCHIGAEFR